MKIFLDTNVLLDVLANRVPFHEPAKTIWSMSERGQLQACISAISFNNIYYIVRKLENKKTADTALCLLRDVFDSIRLDSQILNQAIDSKMGDFEDAIQYFSALRARAKHLITRNPHHFPSTPLSILSPDEFLTLRSEKSRRS